MCVTRLLSASRCASRLKGRGASPVRGKPRLLRGDGSRYRVLRGPSRGRLRSVGREYAGRSAASVKGSSPDKRQILWWPSQYEEAKAASTLRRAPSGDQSPSRVGTTGVLDHGMYTRLAAERERSASGRATQRPRSRVSGQGVESKSKTIPGAEVRCFHSSEEVG